MLNKDLEIIKKKYGENMMKLCRELFPSILEEEGVLSKIILSNFYPNHNLYDDIIDNKLENNFKNYIYNGVSIGIRTRTFTQCGIIITTFERSCVLWKKQIKNMMKIIKKTLLSLLKAVNLFLILSVNMPLIAKIFTIGNISMVT